MELTDRQWRVLLEVVLRLLCRLYPQTVMDTWEESEHKRDKDGKFAATEGGGVGSSAEGKSSEPLQALATQGIQAQNALQSSAESGTITVLTEKEAAAEKDLRRQKTSSIKKSIATLEKRITQHEQKIAFPAEYDTTWEEKDEKKKHGLLKHWEKEINGFRKSLARREAELKRRGEQ